MKNKFMAWLAACIWRISPKWGFSLQYFHHRKRFPNLKNPKDFSEVIGSQMVSGKINEYSELADKIQVREHIKNWGVGEYLPKVYQIWDKAEDISFDQLPERFILKTNHGSGGHIICKSKALLDIKTVREHFKKALKSKYNGGIETQYNSIIPKVYAEEFIEDGHPIPTDYKFMCMDGEIKAILLCFDRESSVHKLTYDTNWKKLPFIQGESCIDIDYPQPENFDRMKSIVTQIASNFEQVRVDLYNAHGRIYIGELTFSADGGILRNFTNDAIKAMGRA